MNNIFSTLLENELMVIADIGAAGGLDKKWVKLKNSVRPILFEPEEKAYKFAELVILIES